MTAQGDAALDALRTADEDAWLAIQFAPTPLRPKLTALFLLRAEIARIPAVVKEPPIGEMRLQWWREAIAAVPESRAPKGQPALAAAEAARLFHTFPVESLAPMIEARARLFYEPYFVTPAALADWLREAEGPVGAAALRLADPAASARDLDAAAAAFAAFALARDARRLLAHPDASLESAYAALAKEAAPVLAALGDAARATLLLAALAPLYRRKAAPTGLSKRWRLFHATLGGALVS